MQKIHSDIKNFVYTSKIIHFKNALFYSKNIIALKLFILLLVMFTAFNSCNSKNDKAFSHILPGGNVPDKLFVLDIPANTDWETRNLLACFQGLINRIDTRIYYVETKQDRFWLSYYEKTFGIKNEKISSIDDLLKRFSKEIDGYILYHPQNPHTLNIATTIGSLKNLLPVTPSQERLIQKIGLKKKEEVKYDGINRIEIYKKALDELLPQCNKNVLAELCVHYPHWPTSTVRNRDYIMAHKIFSFDLSSSERDKSDYNLVKQIYGSVKEGAVVIGWHCVRDKEHEAIGLSSEFGHFGMCTLRTPNLTVHSSIPKNRSAKFES